MPYTSCQVCDLPATHELAYRDALTIRYFRCDVHTAAVRDSRDRYVIERMSRRCFDAPEPESEPEPERVAAPDTATEGKPMIAEGIKPAEKTVKRPDFVARVSRTPRGIMLFVQSTALHAHLKELSEGRTSPQASGRHIFSHPSGLRGLRNANLFAISDAVTAILMDSKLDEGHEIRIADVMTANAAKDYVRDIMGAFSDYVRDYMSALRITGSVTIDETVIRKTPITDSV